MGPQNVYRCGDTVGRNKLEEQLGCAFGGSGTAREEAAKCYFERQRSICMGGDGSRYQRYKSLFETPNMEELERSFSDIVYACICSNQRASLGSAYLAFGIHGREGGATSVFTGAILSRWCRRQ
jgi:hypothetical protein